MSTDPIRLFDPYIDSINRSIERIIQVHLTGQPDTLYAPARYMLSLGGKRLRPALTLLVCDLLGGDVRMAENPAVAVEMFHNFTLVHDDIMDKARLRRGQPTVHEKWNLNVGILSGDLLLICAYKILTADNPSNLDEILHLFNKTAVEVCEGQQYDMDFENRIDVGETEYIHMITLKTATLLGACLQLGCILANSSNALKRGIYEFGKDLGIAFQIQDDLLDAYGESSKVGKRKGGDIIANKKTFLFIHAWQQANPTDRQWLLRLFSGDHQVDPDEKIAQVMNIFQRYNVYEHTCQVRDAYYQKAMQLLEILPLPESVRKVFQTLSQGIVYREK